MLIWIDKDMAWNATPIGKRGRSKTDSDSAIQFCLMIKNLYGLGLRQTIGNEMGDAPMLPELLSQIPPDEVIKTVTADGAYDTKNCHKVIAKRGCGCRDSSTQECSTLERKYGRCASKK